MCDAFTSLVPSVWVVAPELDFFFPSRTHLLLQTLPCPCPPPLPSAWFILFLFHLGCVSVPDPAVPGEPRGRVRQLQCCRLEVNGRVVARLPAARRTFQLKRCRPGVRYSCVLAVVTKPDGRGTGERGRKVTQLSATVRPGCWFTRWTVHLFLSKSSEAEGSAPCLAGCEEGCEGEGGDCACPSPSLSPSPSSSPVPNSSLTCVFIHHLTI